MILERLRAKQANNLPAVGISLRFADPAIVEMIGNQWDFVWIDLQHSVIDWERAANLVRACDSVGVSSFLRLSNPDASECGRALDLDVAGVIVPMVESSEAAERCVAQAKFPPLGNRSAGGRRILDRQGGGYLDRANKEQWLICQIESPAALRESRAIAAVPGVDGLMLGPDDFVLRSGLRPGDPAAASTLRTAEGQLGQVTEGKIGLRIVAGDDRMFRQGFCLLSVGSDHVFLREGSSRTRQAADDLAPRP